MLLQVSNLSINFGASRVLDKLTFAIEKGQRLGIVGESGCGKTVTALALLRLLAGPGRISGGSISFLNQDLRALSGRQLRKVRGKEIAMIFQEPMTALDPVMKIGRQIERVLARHLHLRGNAAKDRACALLDQVGIPDPRSKLAQYPHMLSGGMRQRVLIAMALSCNPALLIADEPTTALDVTTQSAILDLLLKLSEERGLALLLISHDLGVVSQVCEQIMVMYCGQQIEFGATEEIFSSPQHPYTQGLLNSMPKLGLHSPLPTIEGTVPSPTALPSGCLFSPRCPRKIPICEKKCPDLADSLNGTRGVACFNPNEIFNFCNNSQQSV